MKKQMYRAVWILSAVFAVLTAGARAQNLPESRPAVADNLARLVEAFERANKARVGVSVVDLRTGQPIFAHRQGEAMIPASNQKILAAAFALDRLGPQGVFATAVYAAGRDIVVTGQYDPLLGDPILARREGKSIYAELDRWAEAVRAAYGEAIPGDLILASRSTSAGLHPPAWPVRHHGRWYGAAVADLNFHDNCFDVTFVERDGTIQPAVAPASRYIRVLSELKLQPRGRHLWRLRESPDGATLTLTGQIRGPAADPLSTPMRDPRITLGRVLAGRLAQAGVRVGGQLRILPADRVNLAGARLLAKSESTLRDVLHRANKRSLNLAAECMLLRAGDGAWAGSARQMHDVLVERFGLDARTLAIHDGSGLAEDNRVTSGDLAKLLAALSNGPWAEMFLASLPRSGVDGSLKRRLREEPYRGRIAAKTGTLAGVRTLSGYVLDAGDDKKPVIAFSILANDLSSRAQGLAKSLQDQLCRELVDAR
ncbi:MAG: D-alanyl-D-alanine carboxypeptidase/D-alanyl-D-alanine-endopeptidase [Phycisphaerae bacterium]|nr:D-alanyl-D-alanine carboxypeptidase/D-alanyl-D-alanine-endopeptidase [Phycisphaerae bacterium]